MPTYSYACTECDDRFDAVQAFSDDSLTTCTKCNGRLRKLFNSVGVVFKGSGFYRTDSREGSKSTTTSSSSGSESGSSSGSGEKSSGSSDKGAGDKGSSSKGSSDKSSGSSDSKSSTPAPAAASN